MKNLDCFLLFSFRRQTTKLGSACKFYLILLASILAQFSNIFSAIELKPSVYHPVASLEHECLSNCLSLLLPVCGMLFRFWAICTLIDTLLNSLLFPTISWLPWVFPSWSSSQKAWALLFLLWGILSVTPSAPSTALQEVTERKTVTCLVLLGS